MLAKKLGWDKNPSKPKAILEKLRQTRFRFDENYFYNQYVVLERLSQAMYDVERSAYLYHKFKLNRLGIVNVDENFRFLDHCSNPKVYRILGNLLDIACRIDNVDNFNVKMLDEVDEEFSLTGSKPYYDEIRKAFDTKQYKGLKAHTDPKELLEFLIAMWYKRQLEIYSIIQKHIELLNDPKSFKTKRKLIKILDCYHESIKKDILDNKDAANESELDIYIAHNRYIHSPVSNVIVIYMVSRAFDKSKLMEEEIKDIHQINNAMIAEITAEYHRNWIDLSPGWILDHNLIKF